MTNKTLLIIGNGFDLQCGLRTQYTDFFNWLRKDETRKDNIWAVHFLNNKLLGNNNWHDIETGLLKAISKETHYLQITPLQGWIMHACYFSYSKNNPYKDFDGEESYYARTNLQSIMDTLKPAGMIIPVENFRREFDVNDYYCALEELKKVRTSILRVFKRRNVKR